MRPPLHDVANNPVMSWRQSRSKFRELAAGRYIAFYNTRRPSAPEELEMIRKQIEQGFDNIAEVDAEIRGIVARNWPHLVSKLPPEDD